MKSTISATTSFPGRVTNQGFNSSASEGISIRLWSGLRSRTKSFVFGQMSAPPKSWGRPAGNQRLPSPDATTEYELPSSRPGKDGGGVKRLRRSGYTGRNQRPLPMRELALGHQSPLAPVLRGRQRITLRRVFACPPVRPPRGPTCSYMPDLGVRVPARVTFFIDTILLLIAERNVTRTRYQGTNCMFGSHQPPYVGCRVKIGPCRRSARLQKHVPKVPTYELSTLPQAP